MFPIYSSSWTIKLTIPNKLLQALTPVDPLQLALDIAAPCSEPRLSQQALLLTVFDFCNTSCITLSVVFSAEANSFIILYSLNQFAPLDPPVAVEAFLRYWKPNAIMLMASELWPNLIMSAERNGSNIQAIQLQLLQALPFVMNFSGDLKYIVEGSNNCKGATSTLDELQNQLALRKVWMASSLHKGEDKIMLRVHEVLKEIHSDLVTIIVPRHPQHGRDIALELQRKRIKVAVWSRREKLLPGTNIFIVDTLGELQEFYRLTPIAVIGGSFLPGSQGHNISEAATAGCAILTGHYVGHFSHMVKEMQHMNPLSVQQVSEEMLVHSLIELFSDSKILEAHRVASKQAYRALSCGVLEKIWSLVQFHILDKTTPVSKV